MDKYSYIANAHGSYVEELYRAYKENPASVDVSWQKFFEGFDFSDAYNGNGSVKNNGQINAGPVDADKVKKEMEVVHLIRGYRSRGHLLADTNPVRKRKDRKPLLDLKDFNLSENDLNTVFTAGVEVFGRPATLKEIVEALKKVYTGKIGFEYLYIPR